jgi:MFS family permease
MVGAPLANRLMAFFASDTDVGVWPTFLVLGGLYFIAMTLGAFGYRLPPTASGQQSAVSAQASYVPVTRVHAIPQFWLAWAVLCLNVAAGIGVLGMASPMIQEVFGGRLIGIEAPLARLSREQQERVQAIGAAFAALLSLFNILGRIFWASVSDWLGRKITYSIFFLLGGGLYALVPWTGEIKSIVLFVAAWCVIFSMYGGGFAAIPAYLSDLFGSAQISAIHGRLLTAWSMAGILGPVVVNYMRDWQLARGLPAAEAYDATMYLLACALGAGLICNLLIRPVHPSYFEKMPAPIAPSTMDMPTATEARQANSRWWLVAIAWAAVGIPLLWGMWNTLAIAGTFFD